LPDLANLQNLKHLENLDYVHRVNRVLDHVTQNLAEPMQLEDVARIACFSPYHFHRIFRALVGEPLNAFVKRMRLERAVQLMSQRPSASLTDIALAVGFSSSSDFSRSFRAHFGVPPSAFDVETFRRGRRDEMIDTLVPDARHRLERLPPGSNPDNFAPRIRDLARRRVAYVRAFEPYTSSGVADAAARLLAWARPRDLAGGQWLGYQWEDPEVVALADCRYDMGLVIPESTIVDDPGVNATSFPAMKVAEIDIAGGIDLEMRALDWIYKTWLPSSGYVPDHQPGFEAFNGEPFAHGTEYFELRIQIPIVDAAAPL
jgi:AraC family transcriptional regulator